MWCLDRCSILPFVFHFIVTASLPSSNICDAMGHDATSQYEATRSGNETACVGAIPPVEQPCYTHMPSYLKLNNPGVALTFAIVGCAVFLPCTNDATRLRMAQNQHYVLAESRQWLGTPSAYLKLRVNKVSADPFRIAWRGERAPFYLFLLFTALVPRLKLLPLL